MQRDQERTLSPEEERATAREDLLGYLKHGQFDEKRNISFISGGRLRDLVLRAGYTELACLMNGSGQKDIETSLGNPALPGN